MHGRPPGALPPHQVLWPSSLPPYLLWSIHSLLPLPSCNPPDPARWLVGGVAAYLAPWVMTSLLRNYHTGLVVACYPQSIQIDLTSRCVLPKRCNTKMLEIGTWRGCHIHRLLWEPTNTWKLGRKFGMHWNAIITQKVMVLPGIV